MPSGGLREIGLTRWATRPPVYKPASRRRRTHHSRIAPHAHPRQARQVGRRHRALRAGRGRPLEACARLCTRFRGHLVLVPEAVRGPAPASTRPPHRLRPPGERAQRQTREARSVRGQAVCGRLQGGVRGIWGGEAILPGLEFRSHIALGHPKRPPARVHPRRDLQRRSRPDAADPRHVHVRLARTHARARAAPRGRDRVGRCRRVPRRLLRAPARGHDVRGARALARRDPARAPADARHDRGEDARARHVQVPRARARRAAPRVPGHRGRHGRPAQARGDAEDDIRRQARL